MGDKNNRSPVSHKDGWAMAVAMAIYGDSVISFGQIVTIRTNSNDL